MTPRQRVAASIGRQPLDALPWQFDMTGAIRAKLRDYYATDDLLAATGDHLVWSGLGAPRGCSGPAPGPGLYRSEFGAVWRREARDARIGDWGDLVSYPLREPTLAGYALPDGAAPGRADGVPAARQQYPNHFLVVSGISLFEAAWALCGFENYLAHVMGEPEFVAELTERLADFQCAQIAQLEGLGADAVRLGDDWGFQERLMVRPEVWRHLFREPYRRVFEAAHRVCPFVMLHSCGNITDILPDLIEIGLDVVHPLQPEAMDVKHCQREFGRDITFWGGLGSQSTIPFGSPAEIRREVLRLAEEMARGGGYILGPAKALQPGTPVDNAAAVLEAFLAVDGVRWPA